MGGVGVGTCSRWVLIRRLVLIRINMVITAFSSVFIYWKCPAENVGDGISKSMPPDFPRFGRFWCANFSLVCTFKISCYAADYRYLIAYEINAQGWKRLGLEGVGGGRGCILKIVISKWGVGGIQFSYVMIFVRGGWGGEGGKVLIHHTFLKTPVPLWDDRSLRVSLS